MEGSLCIKTSFFARSRKSYVSCGGVWLVWSSLASVELFCVSVFCLVVGGVDFGELVSLVSLAMLAPLNPIHQRAVFDALGGVEGAVVVCGENYYV